MTCANRQRPLWDMRKGRSIKVSRFSLWRKEARTVPPGLVDAVHADTLLHLLDLQTNQTGIGVAVAVVLGQDGDGLLVAALGHKPAGRFRDEPDGDDHDTGSKALQDEGHAPLPVVVDEVAPIGDDGCRDRAAEPAAVVEAYRISSK